MSIVFPHSSARTMWCPVAMQSSMLGAHNREISTQPGGDGSGLPPHCRCIGARCAKWVPVDANLPEGLGSCGL